MTPFAYITRKSCGCMAKAATADSVARHLADDAIAALVASGQAEAVVTQADFLKLTWRCEKCTEPMKRKAKE